MLKKNFNHFLQIAALGLLVVIAVYAVFPYGKEQLSKEVQVEKTTLDQYLQQPCPLSTKEKKTKKVAGCFDYFEYRLVWTPELCTKNSSKPYCNQVNFLTNRLVSESIRPVVDLGDDKQPKYLTNCTDQKADFNNLDQLTLKFLQNLNHEQPLVFAGKVWRTYGTCSQILPWFSGAVMYLDHLYASLPVWLTYDNEIKLPTTEQDGRLLTTYEDLSYYYSRGINFATRQQGYSDHLDYLLAECSVNPRTKEQFLVAVRIYFDKHLLRYRRIKRPKQLQVINECDRNSPIYVRTIGAEQTSASNDFQQI